MAEGTRMKTIEKNIRKLEQLQQQHAIMLNQWIESTNSNLEEFRKEVAEQKVTTEVLQDRVEHVDKKLENYQGNTDRRLENLTDMVCNVSRDREQAHSNLGGAGSMPTPPVVNQIPKGPNLGFRVDGPAIHQDQGIPENLRRDVDRSSIGGTESSRESRPQIVNANSRSRIFDDNLRKMKALAEQHASMMQQWWPSTNQIMTESHQETQFSARAPSNLGVELNLEANSAKQDHGTLCSLMKDQEMEELQDSTVNFDTLVVVSDIAYVDMSDVIVDSRIGEIVAEPIESSGFGWVDPNPSIFLDISSAHKVFVELSRLGVFQMEPTEISRVIESSLVLGVIVDKHRMVDRISVFDPGINDQRGFISWEFTILVLVYIEVETAVDRRNWVFDPGKGLELSSHIERVETILVFDSVQKQHQLLVTLLLCNVATMEALPIYMDKLFNQYLDILYFLNPATGYNHPGHKFYVISYTGAVCC